MVLAYEEPLPDLGEGDTRICRIAGKTVLHADEELDLVVDELLRHCGERTHRHLHLEGRSRGDEAGEDLRKQYSSREGTHSEPDGAGKTGRRSRQRLLHCERVREEV